MAHTNWNTEPEWNEGSDPAREELIQGFGSILESGRGADMTVICRKELLMYHSAIVCARSTFFAAAVWGNFKEGRTKTVKLPDENVQNVKRMMRYFYVLDYNDEGEATVFDVNAQMYAMGDRFGVPGLKKVAAAKFEKHCRCAGGESPADQSQMDSLLLAVPMVYKSTPKTDRALRDSVAGAFARDLPVNRERWLTSSGFKNICRTFPEFIFDILGRTVDSQVKKRYGGWDFDDWDRHDSWARPV
ncbi:MAG: hypothetical protein LQ343_003412 [Gyalolechia ehrenbergii]|nr:MAG: hypothetical protein LQ343_003412 [Gyalolechia ehrenbergii]